MDLKRGQQQLLLLFCLPHSACLGPAALPELQGGTRGWFSGSCSTCQTCANDSEISPTHCCPTVTAAQLSPALLQPPQQLRSSLEVRAKQQLLLSAPFGASHGSLCQQDHRQEGDMKLPEPLVLCQDTHGSP